MVQPGSTNGILEMRKISHGEKAQTYALSVSEYHNLHDVFDKVEFLFGANAGEFPSIFLTVRTSSPLVNGLLF